MLEKKKKFPIYINNTKIHYINTINILDNNHKNIKPKLLKSITLNDSGQEIVNPFCSKNDSINGKYNKIKAKKFYDRSIPIKIYKTKNLYNSSYKLNKTKKKEQKSKQNHSMRTKTKLFSQEKDTETISEINNSPFQLNDETLLVDKIYQLFQSLSKKDENNQDESKKQSEKQLIITDKDFKELSNKIIEIKNNGQKNIENLNALNNSTKELSIVVENSKIRTEIYKTYFNFISNLLNEIKNLYEKLENENNINQSIGSSLKNIKSKSDTSLFIQEEDELYKVINEKKNCKDKKTIILNIFENKNLNQKGNPKEILEQIEKEANLEKIVLHHYSHSLKINSNLDIMLDSKNKIDCTGNIKNNNDENKCIIC